MILKRAQPIQWLVTAIVLLYPVVALTVHNAGNALFYLLLLTSLAALAMRVIPAEIVFRDLFKKYWPLYLAMLSACLAVLLNQAWSGNFAFKFYDRALRLAIFPLIFWVLLFVPLKHLKLLQWSFFTAAAVAAVKAYIFTKGGSFRDGNIGFLSIIAYSDITLLAGVLCVVCLGWREHVGKSILLFSLLGCISGAYTVVLTATRGSWLALPLWLFFFFVFSGIKHRRKWLWLGGFAIVLVLFFSMNQAARNRWHDAETELTAYSQGEGKATSTGIRLQLWGAALRLIAREPVFGIGRENYESSIKEMAERNEVTKDLTFLAHSHNEILFNTVISGMFGLLSILALYIVPGYFFARELRSDSADARAAAQSGCVLVIGFFAFGLTDLMFFWPVLCGYYVIMIAVFLVAIIKAKKEESALSAV